MPKLITMREMLAGAPTGVPGLYGIGDYESAGVAEAEWSPYDQPGRSDRLWHHAAVGADPSQSSGQPPITPPQLQPGIAAVVAKAMCETAKGTWDPVANVCMTAAGPMQPGDMPKLFCQGQGGTWDPITGQCTKVAPAPPPKKPWMSPTTTALVVLGIVGLGAIWAFGSGGSKKTARANVPPRKPLRSRTVSGKYTRMAHHHQKPYEVTVSYHEGGKTVWGPTRRFATHAPAYWYAIKRSKQLRDDPRAMVELLDAEGFTRQFDPGSW